MIPLLIGRLAAIVGICMRNRVGWLLAIGFFIVIIGLNGVVLANSGAGGVGLLRLIVPVGCLIYLFTARGEFD